MKVGRHKNLTLEEYAKASSKFTEPFIYGDADFAKLTSIYERVYYGNSAVSEEEWSYFTSAYDDIYSNIYEEVGRWRYMLLFYRI